MLFLRFADILPSQTQNQYQDLSELLRQCVCEVLHGTLFNVYLTNESIDYSLCGITTALTTTDDFMNQKQTKQQRQEPHVPSAKSAFQW